MRFTTESGSTYEIEDGWVRRVNKDVEKRADDKWVRLLNKPFICPGRSVRLLLDSLSTFGPDDRGVQSPSATSTFRVTSPVVEIQP